jgi:hypothetical protein
MLLDNWCVEVNRFLVFAAFLHEQHVTNVQTPRVMITAKLERLAEYFLDGCIILHVPVDAGLSHQNRNVSLKI